VTVSIDTPITGWNGDTEFTATAKDSVIADAYDSITVQLVKFRRNDTVSTNSDPIVVNLPADGVKIGWKWDTYVPAVDKSVSLTYETGDKGSLGEDSEMLNLYYQSDLDKCDGLFKIDQKVRFLHTSFTVSGFWVDDGWRNAEIRTYAAVSGGAGNSPADINNQKKGYHYGLPGDVDVGINNLGSVASPGMSVTLIEENDQFYFIGGPGSFANYVGEDNHWEKQALPEGCLVNVAVSVRVIQQDGGEWNLGASASSQADDPTAPNSPKITFYPQKWWE